MIRRPPRSTLSSSSAASDVYKRQVSTQSTGRLGPKWRKLLKIAHGQRCPKSSVSQDRTASGWSESLAVAHTVSSQLPSGLNVLRSLYQVDSEPAGVISAALQPCRRFCSCAVLQAHSGILCRCGWTQLLRQANWGS
eukprot:TRINITY_DN233_c0_g1_i18.p1 TRINITY_DN233_c0_g1~~TRINITY_DN233_c0_g1_i18.p1  ORF type:complete len:137 (+),score=1.37 TRINITY_DN233_c0_g1_i18:90-500(+)